MLPSAEAEYVLAASMAQKITQLIKLLKDLDLEQPLPINLYEDKTLIFKTISSDKLRFNVKYIDLKNNCRGVCVPGIFKYFNTNISTKYFFIYLFSDRFTRFLLFKISGIEVFEKTRNANSPVIDIKLNNNGLK